MPYIHHTMEFVKETVEMWEKLSSKRLFGKKIFKQREIIDFINKKYGQVSIRTLKNWCQGECLVRGQGIGEPRGKYGEQGKMPQRARKNQKGIPRGPYKKKIEIIKPKN